MTSDEVDSVLSDPTLPNAPQRLPGHQGSVPHVPVQLARERRAAMAAALQGGASRDAIMATFGSKYGMSEEATTRLLREVIAMWREEDVELGPVHRSAARRRILGHIFSAAKGGKWTAVASLEKVLSEVEGTAAPEPLEKSTDDPTTRVMEVVMAQMSLTDPAQMRVLIERERILIESTRGEVDLRPKSILVGKVVE